MNGIDTFLTVLTSVANLEICCCLTSTLVKHVESVVTKRCWSGALGRSENHNEITHSYSILRVPTTQLAKMSIDLKFVKLTADVLEN